MKHPFDQRPDESAKAFAAFKLYCEQGSNRALREVARKLRKSLTLLGRWSSQHDWAKRVRSYDAHIDATAKAAEEAALKSDSTKWANRQRSLREKDYAAAEALRAKAKEMLAYPLTTKRSQDGLTIIQPTKWTLADVPRMLDIASRLERLACGVETDRTIHTGPDGGAPVLAHPVVVFIPDNGREKKPESK